MYTAVSYHLHFSDSFVFITSTRDQWFVALGKQHPEISGGMVAAVPQGLAAAALARLWLTAEVGQGSLGQAKQNLDRTMSVMLWFIPQT